jgi:hypothetical protein
MPVETKMKISACYTVIGMTFSNLSMILLIGEIPNLCHKIRTFKSLNFAILVGLLESQVLWLIEST